VWRVGVARATLYAHFPTREALIAAVTDRAIAESAAAIGAANPGLGEPVEALERVLAAAWRMLGNYHALVAINASLGPERLRALHEPVLGQIAPIVERGRRSGAFDASAPLHWQLTVVLEVVHTASREASAGRLPEDVAERALLASVTGALAA
jgi:AcrR family transcriptional regulator